MTGKGVDPDVALFAQLVREEEAAKRAAMQEQRRQREEAERVAQAQTAKDDAARRLKDLRAKGASSTAIAEAEAAYRATLAEVVTAESGARPDWAPAPEAAAEADPEEAAPDDAPHGDVEPDPRGGAPDTEPASDAD
jgi:hypothetical protein